MNHSSSLLDTAYSLETPEGVDLQVELAGPVVRTLAFSIDLLIRFAIMLGVLIVVAILGGKVAWAIWLLAYFIIEWWYPVLYEVLRNGQTPGKRAMGIQVIQDDLTPISFSSSLIRNLLRFADFLPTCYTFGFISIMCHPQMKRLGDIAAGSLVVHKKSSEPYAPQHIDVPPVIPPFELDEDEQGAIVEFTLRHDTLSESRQQELSEILQETFSYKAGAVRSLRGLGAWLMGKR